MLDAPVRDVADGEVCAEIPREAHSSHEQNQLVISSSKWGGARPNSGGPRPNAGGARPNSGGARPGAGRKPAAPAPDLPLGPRWYVAQTHPAAERQVVMEMARQGWGHYLPLIAVRRRDRVVPTMFHKDVEPLFRGFVFVEFDRDEATWGCICNNIPGVRSIIMGAGGRPCPVPSKFISDLREDDANRLELSAVVNIPHKVGAKVRINVGPMATCEGMVLDCDGLTTMVSVQMFGQSMPVQMQWQQVEVVGA